MRPNRLSQQLHLGGGVEATSFWWVRFCWIVWRKVLKERKKTYYKLCYSSIYVIKWIHVSYTFMGLCSRCLSYNYLQLSIKQSHIQFSHPSLILSLVLSAWSACRTLPIFSLSSSVKKLRSSNEGSPSVLSWGVPGTVSWVVFDAIVKLEADQPASGV